jgi:hypothetical protein
MGQILESEILVLCDSVLQELSTNAVDILLQRSLLPGGIIHQVVLFLQQLFFSNLLITVLSN